MQAREDLVSPLVFRGPGGLVTASFAGRSDHSELETRFYAGLALLVDRYDTNNAAVSAGINSRWRWDLRHGTHAAVRLGPMLDVHSWIAQYDAWDDSHAYWLGVISAGPSMQLLAHAPAERDWVLDLEFPVIAFVSRPPLHRLNKADDLVDGRYWLSRVATKARLTSVHELQAVRVRATWRGTGAKIRIDPWTAFELDRFSEPRSVTTLGLWLGAEARWGS